MSLVHDFLALESYGFVSLQKGHHHHEVNWEFQEMVQLVNPVAGFREQNLQELNPQVVRVEFAIGGPYEIGMGLGEKVGFREKWDLREGIVFVREINFVTRNGTARGPIGF
ncbi:hypothetical protein AMTR_s00021p00055570 [Amborella trichopoda]|uniref:Uncharacterized protein n=1 Tax=Amborella trichopoda TaxID=13333 RepID=W1Q0F8_AMBTC|nr:hypothetical protein AMTR_s00021p00055570 [Amborella trichopoda]